jgi:hypothetical protein
MLAQAFSCHSNVDEPGLAADTKVRSNKLNFNQKQIVESTNDLVDSNTCLGSKTNSQMHAEE